MSEVAKSVRVNRIGLKVGLAMMTGLILAVLHLDKYIAAIVYDSALYDQRGIHYLLGGIGFLGLSLVVAAWIGRFPYLSSLSESLESAIIRLTIRWFGTTTLLFAVLVFMDRDYLSSQYSPLSIWMSIILTGGGGVLLIWSVWSSKEPTKPNRDGDQGVLASISQQNP